MSSAHSWRSFGSSRKSESHGTPSIFSTSSLHCGAEARLLPVVLQALLGARIARRHIRAELQCTASRAAQVEQTLPTLFLMSYNVSYEHPCYPNCKLHFGTA